MERLSFVAAVLVALAPLSAHAQLEAAEQHFEHARFEEALDALDASALDPAGAIGELELRARVLHALGDDAPALERALARLAERSPEHQFPAEVPPDLAQAFERARSTATPDQEPERVASTELASSAPWYLGADETEDEGSSPVPWIILGVGLAAAVITTVVLVFALQPSRDPNEMEEPSWELPPGFEEEF